MTDDPYAQGYADDRHDGVIEARRTAASDLAAHARLQTHVSFIERQLAAALAHNVQLEAERDALLANERQNVTIHIDEPPPRIVPVPVHDPRRWG